MAERMPARTHLTPAETPGPSRREPNPGRGACSSSSGHSDQPDDWKQDDSNQRSDSSRYVAAVYVGSAPGDAGAEYDVSSGQSGGGVFHGASSTTTLKKRMPAAVRTIPAATPAPGSPCSRHRFSA